MKSKPLAMAFSAYTIQKLTKLGFVMTMQSVKEFMAGIHIVVAGTDNSLFNWPVQTNGADGFKFALYLISDNLEGTDSRIVHTQHDEIITEARDGIEDQVQVIVTEFMEKAFGKIIPEVQLSLSPEWRRLRDEIRSAPKDFRENDTIPFICRERCKHYDAVTAVSDGIFKEFCCYGRSCLITESRTCDRFEDGNPVDEDTDGILRL